MALSKRIKSLSEKVDRNKLYTVKDGLALVKDTAKAKFDESVDVSVNLGIDAKKSDQLVRGALVLPNGSYRFPPDHQKQHSKSQRELRIA